MASYELGGRKFGSSQVGTPAGQVSWSFATSAGTMVQFDYEIIDPAARELIRNAFQAWEMVANIDFVEVADSIYSDFRLGWDYIDGFGGTLAEAVSGFYRNTVGFNTIDQVEIRFDTAEYWSSDKNAVSEQNFFFTALHEIGHGLGLDHSDDPSTLMYYLTGDITSLTPADMEGARVIYGAAPNGGSDYYGGTPDSDLWLAGDGNDTMFGAAGNDTLWGEGGNDRLEGSGGNDVLYGNQGDDLIYGNQNNDLLYGGQNNDTVYGGQDADFIYGNFDNDQLFGNFNNDFLHGGQGDDYLHGGRDNDTLNGGLGDDDLDGGVGADVFQFSRNSGFDDIFNFNSNDGDRIDLQGQGYTAEVGGDGSLVLLLSGGGVVTLFGVQPASFSESWLI